MKQLPYWGLLGLLMMALSPLGLSATQAQPVAGISGAGTTGPGGLDLTITAIRKPDGSGIGHSLLVGGATGPVTQVVPPSGAIDAWCINVERTDTEPVAGDQRINWYIRDVGDGKTAFDQISFVTSIGGDCTTFPTTLGSFLTLSSGDYKAFP